MPGMQAWRAHFGDPQLRSVFAIGFLILFVFIGTFTYVNFQLTMAPLSLSAMSLGLVYFVFLPSMITTPLAGRVAQRFGPKIGIALTLALAIAGLVALLSTSLPVVLAGMALVAVGTFLAQAIATGHVGRTAKRDKAAASGIYLASYYAGGLVGSFVLGQVFDRAGWTACIAVLVTALAIAIIQARVFDHRRIPGGSAAISPDHQFGERTALSIRLHFPHPSCSLITGSFMEKQQCGTRSNRRRPQRRSSPRWRQLRSLGRRGPTPARTASSR
jgi:MFS family permease